MSTSLAPKWAQHLAPGVVRVLFFTVACAAALSLRQLAQAKKLPTNN